MRCLPALCFLFAAVACGGQKTRIEPLTIKAEVRDQTLARPGSDVDALWGLAPTDTAIGIVVAPGTTLRIYDVAEAIVQVVEARGFGAEAMKDVRREMSDLPFDVFDRSAFEGFGIDLALGAALFLDSQENMTLILPVSNRGAFRKLAKGAEIHASGHSIDKLDDDIFCAEKGSLYVCLRTTERLLEVLNAGESPFADRVYRLPPGYRGDVEVVMDVPAFEKMEGERDAELREIVSDPGLLAAVVQIGQGTMTARFWLQGKLRGELQSVIEASKNVGSLSNEVAGMKPSGLLRFILPMQIFDKEVQDETLPGGYSLKRDILEKMTGEIVAYTPSSKTSWGRISFGITEATSFRALVQMACSSMPTMDFLSVKEHDNRCDCTIDWDKVPNLDTFTRALFHGKMLASFGVEDSQISLTIGDTSPVLGDGKVSEIGRELLEQEWNYSVWTQHLSLISSLRRPWHAALKSQPESLQEGMRYGLWLLSHISEFALAVSSQADGLHMMAHVGTYAADQEEAFKAYQAAVAKNIDVGDTTSDFAEIRRRWPDSLAARQSAIASPFSVVIAELIAGPFSAFLADWAMRTSFPAFVKSQESPKEVKEIAVPRKK